MRSNYKLIFLFTFLISSVVAQQQKPFTRWWWMGNAITKEGVKYNLEAFHKAGLGGVEITPIYGVKGEEKNFLPFLSNPYLDILNYTVHIADSLGMKVDMVLGTGWPYGGPQVEPQFAASKLDIQTFDVKKHELFQQIFTNKNPNAQLQHVVAYSKSGTYQNLDEHLSDLHINWQANEDATVYAIYCGKTGQKVKRAAPGGEGFTLDHYSKMALEEYLKPYNEKLKTPVRAIFNDSYEVYDTDYTPHFLEAFQQKRGYDLLPFLPLLHQKVNSEIANRVRSDYRETLSDLLKEDFDRPWTAWATSKGYVTKLQAHGSPGNLLDLYATADIPECETFGSMPFDIPGFRRKKEDIREGDADPVMLKFSTSAAHVTGKPLVSSETFTWLRDHFKTALSQCKPELEELLLNGVNHVFLHGTTYSPPTATWPGWKFYASVNFSPQMPIWKDASALFNYIENCQTLLQKGQPDNEIGLYWPIYDNWNEYLKGELFFQFKIHSLNEWLIDTPFYRLSNLLMEKGYSVDFLSDEFISTATVTNGKVQFKGGSYKAIVVPATKLIPIATLEKFLELKAQGAVIIFEEKPQSVPGYHHWQVREAELKMLVQNLSIEKDIVSKLQNENILPENLVESGLKFIRRANGNGHIYYIVNHQSRDFYGYLPINSLGKTITLFDPDTEASGLAQTKNENGKTSIRLQLKAGKSVFIRTDEATSTMQWQYFEEGKITELAGEYQLKFTEGGPVLPQNHTLNTLESWTKLGENEASFSGTATYETTFIRPKGKAAAYLLKLPDVRESAKVWVNGNYLGTLWANPYELQITTLKKGKNQLKVEVTNLAANRIRAKELAGEEWKIFYEINMVNKDYQAFDAKKWQSMPSGIIGKIQLIELKSN